MEKLNIPKGIAKISGVTTTGAFITVDEDKTAICKVFDNPTIEPHTEDIANLIINSVNTFQQCETLPSELLRQRDLAIETLKHVRKIAGMMDLKTLYKEADETLKQIENGR